MSGRFALGSTCQSALAAVNAFEEVPALWGRMTARVIGVHRLRGPTREGRGGLAGRVALTGARIARRGEFRKHFHLDECVAPVDE
jgi:hypothetical protein